MTKKIKALARPGVKWFLSLSVLAAALAVLAMVAPPAAPVHAASWWDTANQGGLDVVGQAYGQTGVASASNDIRVIVARIIRVVLELLGLIFLILIIVAGFRWMTAGGDEDKVSTARKQLTNGVIGLFIVVAAWAIATYVFNQLLYVLTGIRPVTWSW